MDRKKFWNFFTIVWNWDKFQKFVLFLQKAHIWERNFFRKLIYMGRKCIECFSIYLNFPCMKTSSFKNYAFCYTNTLFCLFFFCHNLHLKSLATKSFHTQKKKVHFFHQNIFQDFLFHNSNFPDMSINVVQNIDYQILIFEALKIRLFFYTNTLFWSFVFCHNLHLKNLATKSFHTKKKAHFFHQNIFQDFLFHNSNFHDMSINVVQNIDYHILIFKVLKKRLFF